MSNKLIKHHRTFLFDPSALSFSAGSSAALFFVLDAFFAGFGATAGAGIAAMRVDLLGASVVAPSVVSAAAFLDGAIVWGARGYVR